MKKRLMCIMLAVVANVALLTLAFATPKDAGAVSSQRLLFNCCKETVEGDGYCCGYCCLFRFDCFGGMCDEEQ